MLFNDRTSIVDSFTNNFSCIRNNRNKLSKSSQSSFYFLSHNQISSKVINQDLLLVKVPQCNALDQKTLTHYANKLHHLLVSQEFKGLIVDLRDNTGGNMGPMIIGLTSVLPNGELFSFQNKYGQKQLISLKNDSLVNNSKFSLKDPISKKRVPLAVLINNRTASSGEMTALAFQGLEHCLFFGQSSAGYTSGNSVSKLYDGAILAITSSQLINRQGQTYENSPIIPDIVTDKPLEEATQWLSEQTK
ncbi:S41 family peptidase [Streptococcus ictaluri]|nr:S41 family peptidase [Streptococcus ictaluri]